MLLEVGLVAAGIPVGWLLRENRRAQKGVDATLTWAVRALLLLLGIALGADKHLLAQLETLGWQALLISLCAVAGSLFCAALLGRLLFYKEGKADPPA